MRRLILLPILLALVFSAAVNKTVAQSVLPVSRQVYQNDAIGVSIKISLPQLQVVEDQYLSNAFGFTIVDPEGRMVLRVALLHRASSAQMEQQAWELVRNSPGLDLHPQPVRIGPHQGIQITGAPGVDPSTYIYLSAHGRLYEIVCPEREDSVKVCATLLESISFDTVIRSLEELGLKRAEDVLYEPLPYQEIPAFKGPADIEGLDDIGTLPNVAPMAAPDCAAWPTSKFLQTPWASTANGDSGWPKGWSRAGPSYYGEGLHQYCNRPNGLNDYHALDFRLKTGDIVYPPASGRVIYAGWTGGGYAGLGRVVIVDLDNGYWSMAAHLSSINVSVGQHVGITSVIGRAGGSGYNQDGYYSSHLHQGLYLNASLNTSNGGIYGGQSVEPRHVRYYGNGGGYYETISKYQWMSW